MVHINSNKTTHKEVDAEPRDPLKTSKNGLDTPQILLRKINHPESTISMLEMRHYQPIIFNPESRVKTKLLSFSYYTPLQEKK